MLPPVSVLNSVNLGRAQVQELLESRLQPTPNIPPLLAVLQVFCEIIEITSPSSLAPDYISIGFLYDLLP
jgi:hypothetical protein